MSGILNLLYKQNLMILFKTFVLIHITGSVKKKSGGGHLDSSFEWPQESSKKLKLRKMTQAHSTHAASFAIRKN